MPGLNPDFQKAMAWGYDAGILSGADTPHGAVPVPAGAVLFDPSAPCTRGTAMSFLWRYAGSPGASPLGIFTDVAPSADYAQAVAWAVENGITSGTSETTFSPNEPCTRGQIAPFLYRCLNEADPGEKVYLPEDPVTQTPAPEPEEEARPPADLHRNRRGPLPGPGRKRVHQRGRIRGAGHSGHILPL